MFKNSTRLIFNFFLKKKEEEKMLQGATKCKEFSVDEAL